MIVWCSAGGPHAIAVRRRPGRRRAAGWARLLDLRRARRQAAAVVPACP